MSLSVEQELQSIRAEISEIATIITRVQDRVVAVTRRAEEETETWQATISDLERNNNEVANNVKWLQHQNAELEHKLAQWKPDINHAIDARNAAIRKLRYARKVIRDLVNENERGESNTSEAKDRGYLRHALIEALDEDSSDTDSERTERPSLRSRHRASPATSRHSAEEDVFPIAGINSTRGLHDISSSLSPSTESSRILEHPVASLSRVHRSAEDPWSIHYSKPPASAELSFGPVLYPRLLEYDPIKETTIEALKRLQESSDLCLRLHALDDLAFVYDPIFLETPSTSYILDWGSEQTNRSLEEYIGGVTRPFHMFVFPIERSAWFYIGAHTWKVAKLRLIWPTLNKKSKRRLTDKLSQRCQKQLHKHVIRDVLDNGELQQLCVEISSRDNWERSKALAQKMGYEAEDRRTIGKVDS